MNTIVIICGGNSCGKTTTLKRFFRIDYQARSPNYYVERILDSKIICAKSFCSPQEQSKFCNVKQVKENIKERTQACDLESKGEPYILLIPFTMNIDSANRKRINENCIIRPIEELRKEFKVYIMYLRKTNAQNLAEKDELMKQINAFFITPETTEKDCDRSKQLETYLKHLK